MTVALSRASAGHESRTPKSAARRPASHRSAAPGKRCSARWYGTGATSSSARRLSRTPSSPRYRRPTRNIAHAGSTRLSKDRSCPTCRGWRTCRPGSTGCGVDRLRGRRERGTDRSPASSGSSPSPTSHTVSSGKRERSSEVSTERQLALDDDEPRAAIAENVLELCAARSGIDGNGDGAEPGAAQNREKNLGAVAAHDGDAIAGLDAGSRQRGRIAGGGVAGLGVGQRHAADGDKPALPVPLGLTQQHLRHRALGGGKSSRSGSVRPGPGGAFAGTGMTDPPRRDNSIRAPKYVPNFCTVYHSPSRSAALPSMRSPAGAAVFRHHRCEPISKSLEEDDEASELLEAEEVQRIELPADEDAALPLNPGEEPLDQPAPGISAKAAAILRSALAAI